MGCGAQLAETQLRGGMLGVDVWGQIVWKYMERYMSTGNV